MPRVVVMLGQLVVAAEALLIGIAGTWRPDAAAWQDFSTRLSASVSIARFYEAPVPHGITGLAPLMILLGVGVIVVFDLVATTLGRPGLAGLLLLAVQTTTGALVDEPLGWGAFLLSALSFVALLASVREVSLIGWTSLRRGEQEVGGHSTEDFNTRTASLRIGVTAVALAVLAPLVVPMLGSGTFSALKTNTGGDGGGSQGVGLDHMFLDMKKNLQESKAIPLVRISSLQRPSYFRIAVLDRFDGNAWLQGPRDFQTLTPQVSPADLTYAQRSGEADSFQVTTLGAYDATTLPAPYPPGTLESPAQPTSGQPSAIQVDQSTWELAPSTDGGFAGNYQFSVSQSLRAIQRSQLNSAPEAPAAIQSRYTQLPSDLPNWVKATADKVTAGATTQYQQATLIQDWFRSTGGFTYSLQSGTGSGLEQLHTFVSDNPADRVGYCEQFSTAMVLFARSLGIPSRVVVGFLNPEASPQGGWQFSTKDLHAWPELYFSGAGWVRFEPTPSARTGAAPNYTNVPPRLVTTPATPTPTYRVTPPSISATPTPEGSRFSGRTVAGIPLGDVLWLLVIVVLGVMGGLPRTAAWVLRRWRRGRATTPRARAEAAWREVVDLAEDLGYESFENVRTLRRTAKELSVELKHTDPVRGPVTASAVSRLALEVEAARYAADYHGATTLEQDWETSLKGLDACVSPRRRRRAAWWPSAVFKSR
jgi:transglutaminase-like putative cysteine protease